MPLGGIRDPRFYPAWRHFADKFLFVEADLVGFADGDLWRCFIGFDFAGNADVRFAKMIDLANQCLVVFGDDNGQALLGGGSVQIQVDVFFLAFVCRNFAADAASLADVLGSVARGDAVVVSCCLIRFVVWRVGKYRDGLGAGCSA